MSEAIMAVAWAGWFLLLIFLLGGLIFLAQSDRSDEWNHEDEFCRCGHDYYDHVHYLPHHPCGALMCGCDTYKKEPRP